MHRPALHGGTRNQSASHSSGTGGVVQTLLRPQDPGLRALERWSGSMNDAPDLTASGAGHGTRTAMKRGTEPAMSGLPLPPTDFTPQPPDLESQVRRTLDEQATFSVRASRLECVDRVARVCKTVRVPQQQQKNCPPVPASPQQRLSKIRSLPTKLKSERSSKVLQIGDKRCGAFILLVQAWQALVARAVERSSVRDQPDTCAGVHRSCTCGPRPIQI